MYKNKQKRPLENNTKLKDSRLDRLTIGQTDTWTVRQTVGQIDIFTGREIVGQIDSWTDRQLDR